MLVTSDVHSLDYLPRFDSTEVKNEPMLFNCDMEAARSLGGPITKSFIERLPADWQKVPLVIDSRVHMLMPGWYPCIPGWHHDDVPRTRPDGQPDYDTLGDRSRHVIALVNADICPTEYAIGQAEFTPPVLGQTVYEHLHRQVEHRLATGELTRWHPGDGLIVEIDDRTWHQGTKAKAQGWRMFIRASRYFDRYGEPIARRNERTNEVRKQVQVYLDEPFKGW